jgi:hypothetical protein
MSGADRALFLAGRLTPPDVMMPGLLSDDLMKRPLTARSRRLTTDQGGWRRPGKVRAIRRGWPDAAVLS